MRPAIHPGEVLAEELEEITVSPTELARQLRVPANRITQIINGQMTTVNLCETCSKEKGVTDTMGFGLAEAFHIDIHQLDHAQHAVLGTHRNTNNGVGFPLGHLVDALGEAGIAHHVGHD